MEHISVPTKRCGCLGAYIVSDVENFDILFLDFVFPPLSTPASFCHHASGCCTNRKLSKVENMAPGYVVLSMQ